MSLIIVQSNLEEYLLKHFNPTGVKYEQERWYLTTHFKELLNEIQGNEYSYTNCS